MHTFYWGNPLDREAAAEIGSSQSPASWSWWRWRWWRWWSTNSPVFPVRAPEAELALAFRQHKSPTPPPASWTKKVEKEVLGFGGFCMSLPVVSNCTGRVRNFCAKQAWSLILCLLQVDSQEVVRFVQILPEIQNWKHQCLCRMPPWSDLACSFWGRSVSAKSLPGFLLSSESWAVSSGEERFDNHKI